MTALLTPVPPSFSLDATLLAHGVGGREDLPLPLGYAVTGAALALVVSFVALGVLWREPRLQGERAGTPLPAGVQRVVDSPTTRWGIRIVGLLVSGYALLGLAGPDSANNPTAHVVYVLLWVGLVPASLLLGPVWRLLNPLRTVYLLLALALRTDPREGLYRLPPGLAYWPAAVGLFAFVWLELVAPERTSLPVLRTAVALYAGVHLMAAALFGVRWFDRGDAFEVWSDLVGRLALFGRRVDGRLVVRPPLDGMASLRRAPGLVAVVMVVLGSTIYDSLSGAPAWIRLQQTTDVPVVLLGTLALVACIGVLWVLYSLAMRVSGTLGSRGAPSAVPPSALPGEFAHTLVPIAIGYVVAHYYSLLVLEGQRAFIYLSDPLVTGADWLGTAERGIDYTWATPTGVATLQVVAIVVGHVLGVVLAHDRAVRLFPRAQALRGQLPLLVLMVAITVTGLRLLYAT